MSEEGSPTLLNRAISFVRKMGILFVVTVFLPTVLAIFYFGIFASNVFISESRFVVRAPERALTGGLGTLLRSAGWANAGLEVYAARDYVLSRDALSDLNRDGAVNRAYGNGSISVFDRFNPLGWSDTREDLFRYYEKKVSVNYDSTSSITTLEVRAFTPQDAYRFNSFLLARAEGVVNDLNGRAQRDLIRVAQAEVDLAKEKSFKTALALARFRDRQQMVDPEKQATVQLQMISKLQDELIATRMRLFQLRRLTPSNPQIPVLESGERSLQREIEEETAKVAGGSGSLAGAAANYQHVMLDNQFAEKQLAAALTAYEDARSEALRKQAYVERIVEPSKPDKAQEPRRIRGILTTLALGLVSWGVLSMLFAGIREHRG